MTEQETRAERRSRFPDCEQCGHIFGLAYWADVQAHVCEDHTPSDEYMDWDNRQG